MMTWANISDMLHWVIFTVGLFVGFTVGVLVVDCIIGNYINARERRHRRIANKTVHRYQPGAFTAHKDYK